MNCKSSMMTALLFAFTLPLSCGEKADESVRARNLTTGEMQTFSSEGDVPGGYIICNSDECAVPEQVPCELLGAEVCQFQPDCQLKVLNCYGSKNGDPTLMGCVPPSANGAPPAEEEPETLGCLIPEDSEICEVTCVSKSYQTCEEITDSQACLARPDCSFETVACALGCECPEGTECLCAPCEPAGVCVTNRLTCGDLNSAEACQADQRCQWMSNGPSCTCGCPPNTECLCDCPVDEAPGFCAEKIEPLFCESQLTEGACLADPACEWGQFMCPAIMFDSPQGNANGEPMPFECTLSCRTRQMECPPIPAYEIDCVDGSHSQAIFDSMGCLIGWECSGELPCNGEMCAMFCEKGFQKDANGCEICSCQG